MSDSFAKSLYTFFADTLHKSVNDPNDILKFIAGHELYKIKEKKNWDSKFTVNDIKYEHIIYVNDRFYRKIGDISGNCIQLKEIIENNKIWYNPDKVNTMPTLFIDYIERAKDIIVLQPPTVKKHKTGILTHGTGYRQRQDAEYAPYNFYGNWFIYNDILTKDVNGITLYGESKTYFSSPNINYFYTYNLKNDYDFFHLNDVNLIPKKLKEKNSLDALSLLLIYIMYFDIAIGSFKKETIINNIKVDYSENFDTYPDKILLFYDQYTIRNSIKDIEKYNYTQFKNNLNLTGPPIGFSSYWMSIKATDGDGDKPVAAKLCDTNSMDDTHLKIKGWYIANLTHLMICNPKELVINKDVYINLLLETNKNLSKILQPLINKFKIDHNIKDNQLKCYIYDNDYFVIKVSNNYYSEFNKFFGNNIKDLKTNAAIIIPQITPPLEKIKTEIINEKIKNLIITLGDNYLNKFRNNNKIVNGEVIKNNQTINGFEYNQSIENNRNAINFKLLTLIKLFITNKDLPRLNSHIDISNDDQIADNVNTILNDPSNSVIKKCIFTDIIATIQLIVKYACERKAFTETIALNLYDIIERESIFTSDKKNMFNKVVYKFFEVLFQIEKGIEESQIDINIFDTFPEDYLKVGGYKQKYLKYKQKYLQLKNSLL
jgi:hypothetical protein